MNIKCREQAISLIDPLTGALSVNVLLAAVWKNHVSHGDRAMGFPHDETTHHFRMMSYGGVIEVTVNDPSDKLNTEEIRSHLSHVTMMFGNGDFSIPMFVHDGVPPGVTTMKLMKSAIHYTYEEMPSGASVRIKSDDPIGVAAIHDFLRFQITDHQTGDTLEVAPE